jgi:CDP-glycerol glycerophosphotransferase (TagB/SpsB family)
LLVLTDQKLRDMGIDFYQLLSLTDALVTDYSSIYADYLLLDRPMVFVPADEDFFNEQRGLLLNPYDVWMPGPKCRNQQQLQDEISHSLEDSAYFQHERQFLRGVFHRFTDGKSTERVANFILSKLEN